MTPDRYRQLCVEPEAKLTQEELEQGWHFCVEWDYMLIAPWWPEYEACLCEGHKKFMENLKDET